MDTTNLENRLSVTFFISNVRVSTIISSCRPHHYQVRYHHQLLPRPHHHQLPPRPHHYQLRYHHQLLPRPRHHQLPPRPHHYQLRYHHQLLPRPHHHQLPPRPHHYQLRYHHQLPSRLYHHIPRFWNYQKLIEFILLCYHQYLIFRELIYYESIPAKRFFLLAILRCVPFFAIS